MKTIIWRGGRPSLRDANRDLLHIETPGAIVNICVGLTDRRGRAVIRVDVLPDDEARGGDAQGRVWRLVGSGTARVVRLKERAKR
jgi:hypothetical protein